MKTKILLLVLMILSSASLVRAYSPPIDFILNSMVQDRTKAKAAELTGKITDLKTHAVFTETLRLDFVAGKAESNYLGPNNEVLGARTVSLKDLHPLGMVWIELGIDPNHARFKSALNALGVLPAEKAEPKITRIGTRPVWVWGEQNRIQIEKDTFALASYSNPNGSELLVQESTPSVGEMHIPRVLRFRKSGQEMFLYELKGFKAVSSVKAMAPAAISEPHLREWVDLVR